jgi:hypothetical protein
VQFVAPYVTLRAQEEQKKRLTEGNPPVFIRGRPYDWSLNAQAPARPAGAPATLPASLPRSR